MLWAMSVKKIFTDEGRSKRTVIILSCLVLNCCMNVHSFLFSGGSESTRIIVFNTTHGYKSIPPRSFCNVPSLKYLYLNRTLMPAPHPLHNDSFCCLNQLLLLDLSYNHLQSLPFGGFRSLASLHSLKIKGWCRANIWICTKIKLYRRIRRFQYLWSNGKLGCFNGGWQILLHCMLPEYTYIPHSIARANNHDRQPLYPSEWSWRRYYTR